MKIVLISPHRDDAAFSAGLAIQAWLEAGHTVSVINCFTRSEYGPFAETAHLHPNDRMERISAIRLREDLAWRGLYGTGLTLLDLNLKDAPLRRHCRVEQVCGLAVDVADKALVKTQKAVAREQPDALVLPLALGGHVDHVTARDALLTLAATEMPLAFYEDLPYADRSGSDDPASAAGALPGGLEAVYARPPGNAAAAVETKRRYARTYDSQIDSAETERIATFCLRYGGRERLWGNAGWLRSALMVDTAQAAAVSEA